MNGNFDWVPIYKKIARKVLEFKDNRKELLKIMYDILESIGKFNDDDDKNCNFDRLKNERIKYDDFDPFSFMNRLACYGFDARKEFIKLFEEKTNMDLLVPTGFDGIPSVYPRQTCMIRFKEQREDTDIDKLWKLFESSIKYADEPNKDNEQNFIGNYDIVRKLPLCKYNISCCLFRLNPDFYISLDINSINYMKSNLDINIKHCPSGEEYIDIIKIMKNKIKNIKDINTLYEFSYLAWLNRDKYKNKPNKNKVWILACGESGKLWNDFKDTNTISIGWNDLGNLTNIDSDEIKDLLDKYYPNSNNSSRANDKLAIDNFVNGIHIGDTIIIKKGSKTLVAYGKVMSDYYYAENEEYKNKRKVVWEKINEVTMPENEQLVQKTLTDITNIPTNDKRFKFYYERLLSLINEGGRMNKVKYYFLVTNRSDFSFKTCGIGHEEEFKKTKIGQCFTEVEIGDKIICYEAHPLKKIVALCEISSRLDENNLIKIKKVADIDSLENVISYEDLKKYNITSNIDNRITLFELNENIYNNILDEIKEKNPLHIGYNKIYYGVPGCGKSYKIKKNIVKGMNYIRTTFYPDYSNSDFIGQVIPETDQEGKLRYDFIKGPFTEILDLALNNKFINYYLIIEELNRGNASAIFGDIFQLLDRDKFGKSETTIINRSISNHIKYKTNEIFIPDNLSIIATMNTSDQNVYALDTAFKRRWEMERVKNDNDSDEYKNLYIPGSKHKWNEFYNIVNSKIRNSNNEFNYNSEDKELGAYFAEKSILSNKKCDNNEDLINKFAYKVLFYIWDDVVKFERNIWFGTDIDSFDKLCDEFKKKHLAIFKNISEFNDDSESNDKDK